MLCIGLVHLLFLLPLCAQPSLRWVTAYYSLWSVPTLYPESIDYGALTHIVHFSANPVRTPPYLDVLLPAPQGSFNQDSVNIQYGGVYNGNNPPLWRTIDLQKTLIERAHGHGVKVLLSVGGIYGDGAAAMSYIAKDPARADLFVRAACAYARRKGYDGIELDWEHPYAAERDQYRALIMRFRAELDRWPVRGVFITAVNHTPWPTLGFDAAAMNACFDQINMMTYEMYAGNYEKVRTGHSAPMHLPAGDDAYRGYAVDQPGRGPKAWMSFGIEPQRLGLGVSLLTTEFYNVEPPVQPSRPFGWHNWGYVKNIPAAGRHWDASAQVPWQASGTTFITYEDSASVRIKVSYARSLGLGGVMVYDLLGGFLPEAPAADRHRLAGTAWQHSGLRYRKK